LAYRAERIKAIPPPLDTYDAEDLEFYNKLKTFIEGKDEEVCSVAARPGKEMSIISTLRLLVYVENGSGR
jgi:hypothetical protein